MQCGRVPLEENKYFMMSSSSATPGRIIHRSRKSQLRSHHADVCQRNSTSSHSVAPTAPYSPALQLAKMMLRLGL